MIYLSYKEEFDFRLEQAKTELNRLRSKVDNCDLEGILIIAGEAHRHLVDARLSWRQSSRRELTQDEIGRLKEKLEKAESEFDDIQIDFEVDCKCPVDRHRSDLTDILSGKLHP